MPQSRIALVTIHVGRGPQAVPLGAACVAAALKADTILGSSVSIDLIEGFPDEAPVKLAARVAEGKPDLIGFSLYVWNRSESMECAAQLRLLLKDAVLFVGGPEAGANSQGLLGTFDFLIAGEGEGATVSAIRALTEGRNLEGIPGLALTAASIDPAAPSHSTRAFPFAPLETPSTLPSPWLSGVLSAKERSGVLWELARGCPYACTYCYESKGERKLRRIPEERIRAELALFAREKVRSAFVLDPTFNADKERARRLLDLIDAEGKEIHFHFEVRAESLDRGMAKRFAQIGASLQIGLQTARPEISEKVGRKLDRGLFASKITLLNEEGAVFGLDLIYGLPGDDLAGFRGSLDFALSLYPNNLDVFRLSLLPGTVLADEAASLGMVHDETSPYLVRATKTFSALDLDKAERLAGAIDLFYNRGRAVPWFNQVLHPLSEKASFFLEGFAAFIKNLPQLDPKDPVGIERRQLEYLDKRYESADLEYLLPAVWDIVRFNGAYARALAEGITTTIDFNYNPNEVLSQDAADIEQFATLADMRGGRYRVVCTDNGPELVR
ncbi:MAG: B12-binding domain-containing radical SAM protein [Treponemataceae bacterium]